MAKKQMNDCKTCIYNAKKCRHESNKGIVIKYRVETPVYFKSPDELNKNGDCKYYVELSKK